MNFFRLGEPLEGSESSRAFRLGAVLEGAGPTQEAEAAPLPETLARATVPEEPPLPQRTRPLGVEAPIQEDPISKIVDPTKHPATWALLKTAWSFVPIVGAMTDPEWQARLEKSTGKTIEEIQSDIFKATEKDPLGGSLPEYLRKNPEVWMLGAEGLMYGAAPAIAKGLGAVARFAGSKLASKFPFLQKLNQPISEIFAKRAAGEADDAERYAQYWIQKEQETRQSYIGRKGLREQLAKEEELFGTEPEFPRTLESAAALEQAAGREEAIRQSPVGKYGLARQLAEEEAASREPRSIVKEYYEVSDILNKGAMERTATERETLRQWGVDPAIEVEKTGKERIEELIGAKFKGPAAGAVSTEILRGAAGGAVGGVAGAAVAPEGQRTQYVLAGTGAGVLAGLGFGGSLASLRLPARKIIQKLEREAGRESAQKGIWLPQRPTFLPRDVMNRWERAGLTHKELAAKAENATLDISDAKQLVTAAIEAASSGNKLLLDDSKRVMWRMYDWMKDVAFDPASIPEVMAKAGIKTPGELAEEIVLSASYGGQMLSQLSRFAKFMAKAFPDDPAVKEAIAGVGKQIPWHSRVWNNLWDLWLAVDNKLRAVSVSQMATLLRNIESSAVRYGVDAFDLALQGVFDFTLGNLGRKASGEKLIPAKEAFAGFFNDIMSVAAKLSPTQRAAFDRVLSSFPVQTAKLLGAPMHDVVLNGAKGAPKGVIDTLLFFHRGADYFMRKLKFWAAVKTRAEKFGYDLDTLDQIGSPKLLNAIFEPSIREAQEISFAAPTTSPWGNWLMRMYSGMLGPNPLTVFARLVQRFPNFYGNALRFIWDFGPWNMVKTIPEFASTKNWQEANKKLSRAVLGSAMLYSAIQLREDPDLAGEKWYQLKLDVLPKWLRDALGVEAVSKEGKQRYLDMRAFGPFVSYLFLADLVRQIAGRPVNLEPSDFAQGLFSINRIAGTGLVFVDLLEGRRLSEVTKAFNEVVGQYIGQATVPFRTVKDWAAAASDLFTRLHDKLSGYGIQADTLKKYAKVLQENAEIGFTREHPLYGPIIENIPFRKQIPLLGELELNPLPLITEKGVSTRRYPGLRQATGLVVQEKDEMRKAIDALDIRPWPRTGEPGLDRLVMQGMGEVLAGRGDAIMERIYSKGLSADQTKQVVEEVLAAARSIAMAKYRVPYYVEKIKKIETLEDKLDYLGDLAERRKVGVKDLAMIVAITRLPVPREQWKTMSLQLR